MGGARYLGMDCGVPQSKEQDAFNLFIYWLLCGGVFTFGMFMLFFPIPNFTIPSVVYVLGLIFFWRRYFKLEMNDGRKKCVG